MKVAGEDESIRLLRGTIKGIEEELRSLMKRNDELSHRMVEWMREVVERKGLEPLVDMLEEMKDSLRLAILLVSGSPIEFLPTLGDVHYLRVTSREEGARRKIGPKGEVSIYCIPLHEGKSGKKVLGHICVALHIPTGKGLFWLLPNKVASAASLESDLLAWMFIETS